MNLIVFLKLQMDIALSFLFFIFHWCEFTTTDLKYWLLGDWPDVTSLKVDIQAVRMLMVLQGEKIGLVWGEEREVKTSAHYAISHSTRIKCWYEEFIRANEQTKQQSKIFYSLGFFLPLLIGVS